ncbi:uncharacterized protein LOC101851399 [Aplysia californica]|uniref:Uncharacterized protein LOC101851399 n=1 Tax=Aplysia californica TaxID=6500 RepID=A0ABM0JK75_APLCA|nr:uncharacterized protein LOC101851399 [Aplysia californica]
MFVSHAKVRIVGLGGRSKRRRPHRRRLAVKEVVRMPCLLPTVLTVFLGLLAVAGGAGMSVIGFVPTRDSAQNNVTDIAVPPGEGQGVVDAKSGGPSAQVSAVGMDQSALSEANAQRERSFYLLKICAYVGPVIMAVGMFAMIVACVFYCEILDKYAILVPERKSGLYDKEELYQVIVGEMKKSYAQTLITAYTKAAERSLLAADTQSVSDNFLPDFPIKPEPLTIEQQIDIECEGYAPSPPVPNKRYSVIQARIQRLRSEDHWLKTSSLPNIRRSDRINSIKRAGRAIVKSKGSSLSCDYTMDEARLRRKSMMLRSIVQWNSSSSGDLNGQRQRRFSSVKALPSEQNTDNWDAVSHAGFAGSYPMTRLIQRRGTFACGDMRTRRMKFLLLLQASESKDLFSDTVSIDGRVSVPGIRRNSFIPYTTCDRFISGEEKKTMRDSRRSSVNPFMFGQRFATEPKAGTRRHSFFPIRRDDKIYVVDPNEQRRHSFNPICVNNTLKPEFAAKLDGRRGSFNPDARRGSFNPDSRRGSYNPDSRRSSFNPDSRRSSYIPDSRRGSFNPDSRRGSYIPDGRRGSYDPDCMPDRAADGNRAHEVPPQNSFFLQVPGFEHEFQMERHPPADNEDFPTSQTGLTVPDPGFLSPVAKSGPPIGTADSRRVERRHSHNPGLKPAPPNDGSGGGGTGAFKIPKITINAVTTNNRYLGVPTQEYYPEERRHTFNAMTMTRPQINISPAGTVCVKSQEKPAAAQRISFLLDPNDSSSPPQQAPSAPGGATSSPSPSRTRLTAGSASPHTTPSPPSNATSSPEPVRPSSFKQEMVVFKPLPYPTDSRSASPSSNVSNCGSENVWSDRSLRASSPGLASVSSDRSGKTARTASPVSVIAADVTSSYGTFDVTTPPSAWERRGEKQTKSPRSQQKASTLQTLQVSSASTKCAVQLNPRQEKAAERGSPVLVRRSSSFKERSEPHGKASHSRHKARHRPHQQPPVHRRPARTMETEMTDSPASVSSGQASVSSGPASISSGPATLSPSVNTDANAAIQRSRSTSALGFHPDTPTPPLGHASSPSGPALTVSYATNPHGGGSSLSPLAAHGPSQATPSSVAPPTRDIDVEEGGGRPKEHTPHDDRDQDPAS